MFDHFICLSLLSLKLKGIMSFWPEAILITKLFVVYDRKNNTEVGDLNFRFWYCMKLASVLEF